MAKRPTDRSTLRLSEVARSVVYPSTIVSTEWPRVVAKCAEIGVTFDEWQHGVGKIALGKRRDGKYAATVGGVVLSIPRQVGKTFLVGQIVVALCLIHPNLTVLWSAHRTRTGTKTFQSMQGWVKRPKVAAHLMPGRSDGIRTANGEQEIEFRNGSKIMFGARADGFGRGFDEVDIEVFDEAQILHSKALEDMVAATNQSRREAGALLFFMGTPPRPLDPSDEWMNRRKKALDGKSDKMVYVDIGAEPDDDIDSHETWAKANPSFPHHTPVESMERLRENLTDEDSFRREGLGIYDNADGRMAFAASDWFGCQGAWVVGDMKVSGLALAVSFDMAFAALVVAAVDADAESVTHVRLVKHAPGVAWVSEAVKAAQTRVDLPVLVDPMSPANVLVEVLERDGVKVQTITTQDVFTACGGIDLMVRERRLRHSSQPELDRAVERAKRKTMRNGRWVWDRQPDVDSSPLEAATLAAWMTRNSQPKRSAYEDHDLVVI